MTAHLKLVRPQEDFATVSKPGVTEILHHLGLDQTPPSAAAAKEWANRKAEITGMFTHLQCETVEDLASKTDGGKHMPEVAKFFGIPVGNADSIEMLVREKSAPKTPHLS